MTLAKLFIYFILTAFIGYVYECIAMTVWSGKWDNRGFMFGPIIPIYGVGCLLGLLFFGTVFKSYNVIQVFLAGFIMSAVLEYPTSYILEKIFHTRWWDYSIGPWNIEGRVSLLSSLGFGIGAVLIVFVLNPLLVPIIEKLDDKTAGYIAIVLAIIFIIDFIASVYFSIKKTKPQFYTDFNEKASETVAAMNPKGLSLYKFLKRTTGLFK